MTPILVALALWALPSALVVSHVLRAGDFVMAEVRRHGLVGDLIVMLAWFALPYLAAGLACAIVARGLCLLRARVPVPAGGERRRSASRCSGVASA